MEITKNMVLKINCQVIIWISIHVPFNLYEKTYLYLRFSSYSGESTLQKSNGKPIKYKINQRGSGDYLLCRDCNSYCGTWYVKEFDKIAKIIGYKLLDIKDEYTEGVFELEIGKVNLLAFYKQLISILSCTLPHDNVKKLGFDKFFVGKRK